MIRLKDNTCLSENMSVSVFYRGSIGSFKSIQGKIVSIDNNEIVLSTATNSATISMQKVYSIHVLN